MSVNASIIRTSARQRSVSMGTHSELGLRQLSLMVKKEDVRTHIS